MSKQLKSKGFDWRTHVDPKKIAFIYENIKPSSILEENVYRDYSCN